MHELGPRGHVVGPSSSGKSTLAEELARCLDASYVELDALYWRPGWVSGPDDEVRVAIEEATGGAAVSLPATIGSSRDSSSGHG